MKLPVRVRIKLLTDEGSFEELPAPESCVCITGSARVNGRRILVYALEHEPGPAVDMFGSLQQANRIAERALAERTPLAMLLDAPGRGHSTVGKTPLPPDSSRLLADPNGAGRLYTDLARLSGEVPRVAALFGQTGAALVFPNALCDALVMLEDAGVCIGRPDAVRHMVGENVDYATLGGARMHATVSGLADAVAATEPDALAWMRRCLACLPDNRSGRPPRAEPGPTAAPTGPDDSLIPEDPDKPFDIRPVLDRFLDAGSLFELKELFAREVITGLARVEGRAIGVVANQARCRGGILFPETCYKISRFVSICDAFNIPMVFLADTPGFMIGTAVERAGIIRAASSLFSALANATVPRLVIVARRAHTAGLYAMAGPGFDPAGFLALPRAAISVFGKRALDRFAADREMPPPARRALEEMLASCTNPRFLADKGLLDAVIEIRDLRPRIAAFLERAEQAPRPDTRRPVWV
jgi:acetyl-CoA carboxylase carboxyltransferase component